MADIADNAQPMIDAEAANRIDRLRRKNAPETHPDFDGTHCVECDDEIPAARLALQKVRCVICQSRIERTR